MATISPTDIADLTNTTIARYKRNWLQDVIADRLRNYYACDKLLKGGALIKDSGGGTQYTWDAIYRGDGNARNIGLFEVDNLNQVDGTIQLTVPWRYMESGCHYDRKQLPINSGRERLVNFLKTKEYQMYVDYFELMEENFWQGAASSSDEKVPYGLFGYWATYNATEGFNGGNHSNWSSGKGGKSASTYTGMKHWTAQYTSVTKADLVDKVRRAIRRTAFKAVPNAPISGGDANWDYKIVTHDDVVGELEDLAMDQNDQVGADLAAYDGRTTIRRIPIDEVPWITDNKGTSKPVVGLNMSRIKVAYPEGEWMREQPYAKSSRSHEVFERFLNTSAQYAFEGLRDGLFLISKSDPTSS